jgi:hypothetical protein
VGEARINCSIARLAMQKSFAGIGKYLIFVVRELERTILPP